MRRVARLAQPKWVLLAAVAATGALAQLYATTHGAGISPDSTAYLAAARSISQGQGFQHLGSGGDLQPLAVWAPLYPLVLASGAATGIDLLVWARALNATLIFANLVLAGLMIGRHNPTSRLAPAIGAGLLLISEDFLTVHAWVWTEPLALFSGFLGLYWLDRVLLSPRPMALVPPALILGLSCLIRYASLPFVAAGVLGILLFGKGLPGRARLARSALFGSIALLPFAGWSLRMLDLTGRVAGRAIQFRPTAPEELERGLRIAADWILPGRIQDEAIRTWAGGALLLIWVAGALAAMVRRNTTRRREIVGDVSHVVDLLTLFVIAYAAMIVGARFYLSPSVSISERIFSLGYAGIVVAAVGYGGDMVKWARSRAGIPAWATWASAGLLAVLLMLWGGFQLTHTMKWARGAHAGGLGYATVEWRDSPLIRYVRDLPPGTPIYSNGQDAIYALTGIAAKALPDWPGGPATAGVPLPAPIAQMRDELAVSGGVIVYFRGITWRSTLSETELKRILPLRALFGTDEGSIYGIADTGLADPQEMLGGSSPAGEMPARGRS